MNHKEFVKELKAIDACPEAVKFVIDNKYSLKQAWDNCERADWMLWLIYKKEMFTKSERIHATCDCAETSLKYVPKGEDRQHLAIESARNYADDPSQENLDKLNSVWAAGDAAWAAGAVARAAGAAARAAGAAAWAAGAVARAAGAAAWAAGDARAAMHKKMCKLIRKRLVITRKA